MTLKIPVRRHSLSSTITRPSREKSENRSESILWLDKNENMDPMYRQFIHTLVDEIPSQAVFAYPDCHKLYHKLSAFLSVPINQLIIAAGSDGIIRSVYDTFIMPGDTVIYTDPTFAMYELYAQMVGAKALPLSYEPSDKGPVLTVEIIVKAIETSAPKLVCLPNPNSPTGTVFAPEELRHIIQITGEHGAVILIDEAYHPFYTESVLPLINEFPHLIVARTFSKAWGCAGIRLGFGIANQELIQDIHKIRPMYEGGALSFTIAERLLDHADQMLQSVQRLNAGKKYFLEEMENLGLRTLESEGNFLHVAFGEYAPAVHQALSDKVLYRLNFAHPALAGFSRFTATTKEVFSDIVEVIKNIIEPSTPHPSALLRSRPLPQGKR
jgi:histidinol-phosphate aminotransferase